MFTVSIIITSIFTRDIFHMVFYIAMKRFMITKNLVVQTLVVDHRSLPVTSNSRKGHDQFTNTS